MYTNTSSAIGEEEVRHLASHAKSFKSGIGVTAYIEIVLHAQNSLRCNLLFRP
jgi:hypothetical protein